VALFGAQIRIVALLLIGLIGMAGRRGSGKSVGSSIRKYFTITKWALGLKRPAIHG
jgi:hypothetical protein